MKKLIILVSFFAILFVPLGEAIAFHQTNFEYLVGTGLLCGLGPEACPAIALTGNGNSIELMGEGRFWTTPRRVTGGGTFVHKDSESNVVGQGTWQALMLMSFESYGSGSAQGLPPEFWGGLATMRVMLKSSTGRSFLATLAINCTLGDAIPEGAVEGVKLDVQRALNFDEEVSGFTLFIRQ